MKKILLLCFILTSVVLRAQRAGEALSVQTGYGFVLRHADKMGQAALTHPYLVEISYSRLTNGSREWHRPFRYPETGVAAGFLNFHTDLLGKALYIFPYLEKKMVHWGKAQLNLRIGFGGAYLTNPYDPETNFQNVAISTRLNYLLRGEGALVYPLSFYWKLRFAGTLTHFSNGGFKQPNSGINIIALKAGVLYLPRFRDYKQKPDTFSHAFRKGFSLNLAGAFTVQEIAYPGGKKYFGGNFIAYLNYRINRKSALNAGLDLFLNSAHKKIAEQAHPAGDVPDFKQAGLTLGHELFIHRLSLLTQLGYYFYAPQPNQAAVYQRYALKYWWTKHFYTALALKAHFGTAEYTEWTAGLLLD